MNDKDKAVILDVLELAVQEHDGVHDAILLWFKALGSDEFSDIIHREGCSEELGFMLAAVQEANQMLCISMNILQSRIGIMIADDNADNANEKDDFMRGLLAFVLSGFDENPGASPGDEDCDVPDSFKEFFSELDQEEE